MQKVQFIFALSNIFDEIRDRVEELRRHEPDSDKLTLFRMALIEPKGMSDFINMPGRCVLVTGLLSLFWFWCEEQGWPDSDHKIAFDEIFPVPMFSLELWGEGVVPQILVHLWHWRETDATQLPNYAIDYLLGQILA